MAIGELVRDVGLALGVTVVACGAAFAVGSVVSASPDAVPASQPGVASPEVTPGASPSVLVSPSPSPSPSPSASASASPTPPATEEPPPAEPKPAAKPTNTAFGDIDLSVIPAGPMEIGPIGVHLQGEIRLAPGATVSCTTTMGGTVWPEDSPYIGEPWIGNFHPYVVWFDNIDLTPGEYPYTTTCTTSDGVSWTGSGTAHQEQFIGYGAEWP